MKLQSYYFDVSGKAYQIAERIAKEYRVKADKMPPAYQPERELVLFITIEGGKIEEPVAKFLKTLTTQKAKSVALCVLAKDQSVVDSVVHSVQGYLDGTGVKLHEKLYPVMLVKKGFFKKAEVNPEQLDGIIPWTKEILSIQTGEPV